ncbi:hypothetical protein ASD91_01665 [Pseudomonas sp. Root68]|uniref:hypothetical protein n=1 Tax=unclassified Pseudomonas TaxID=196821 RepID=UPI0006F4D4CF|nr:MULTISPECIES: hypothetical protein [unclassified Pseudomonas]KRB05439.1 hypothetical protein ASD91_01665 [Pseudomonas sp. Root68]KRB65195.1 hypothetical protein ASD95_11470 [Pseudomonas sp. Root71]
MQKHLFCTLLGEIRVQNLLPKTQISISGAYFSAVEFEADFFNKIGRFLPGVTTGFGSVLAKRGRETRWSSLMQMTVQVACKRVVKSM